MIVISAGMPKAGSGWYFNLTNSLLAGHGGTDVRELRQRSAILRRVTSSAGGNASSALGARRMAALAIVRLRSGGPYTIKTHSAPTPAARLMLRTGLARATYCYRDLRDVALSAVDHRTKREGLVDNRVGGSNVEQSIDFATSLVPTWRAWTSLPHVLAVSYEKLRTDPEGEVGRLADFLEIAIEPAEIRQLLDQHPSGQGSQDWKDGMHFNRGEIGRFRREMTPDQQAHATRVLGPYLAEMGYEPH